MTSNEAKQKIAKRCEQATCGQCVDIPLSIFHEAYGPADPSLEDVIQNLKRVHGFEKHELRRDLGWLTLFRLSIAFIV